MPLFEYRCIDCQKKFSVLIGVVANANPIQCPLCHSKNAKKLLSRFARLRSEEDMMDKIAENIQNEGDNLRASKLREYAKDMSAVFGEGDADTIEEMIETDINGGEEE